MSAVIPNEPSVMVLFVAWRTKRSTVPSQKHRSLIQFRSHPTQANRHPSIPIHPKTGSNTGMAIDAQTIATLAAGIGGTLGTIKLIRFVASRRNGPEEEESQPKAHETVREYKERLFPNGERDEIITQIRELRAENLARRQENIDNRLAHREIKTTLQEILERMERAKL